MTRPTPFINTASLRIDTSPSRRHGYPHPNTAPPSPSSPLSQPPFFADYSEDDVSPAGTSVVTPSSTCGSSASNGGSDLKMSHDHSMLASLSQMPSPNLNLGNHDVFSSRHAFPLLPPHHPLRNKMYANADQLAVSLEDSPPTTPKGHPLEKNNKFFKFSTHPISSTYSKSPRSYGSALTYLLRVPRRLRPLLLIGFSLLVFGIVYLNHAMHYAQTLDSLPQHRAAEISRRLVVNGGVDVINERHRQAVLAQQDEAVIQSSTWGSSKPNALKFTTHEEEIASLIAFVTSTTANALPLIDPSVPLDPSVVLDFDPARPSAREDLALLVNEIHTIFPIILFGKMRDPWHREVKKMLADYQIVPPPLIIDVDQRRDHIIFVPLLERLLGTSDLPQLLLKGKSLGSYHDVLDMRDKGIFSSTLEESGAVSVRDAKKKKKGVKELERVELERILGPDPIREE